jgi:hypothetical protein
MALNAGQINPALYPQPNYSGVVQSAQMQSQGMADIGKQIGGAITQVGDYFKQQKEKAKSVDTASRIAGLLESKAPDLIPGIGELKVTLEDQEIPLSQRIAAAESLFDLMKVGYEVKDYNNKNRLLEMQMQRSSEAQSVTQDPSRGGR